MNVMHKNSIIRIMMPNERRNDDNLPHIHLRSFIIALDLARGPVY